MRLKGFSEIKEDIKWRDVLSKDQIKLFEKIAGKTNRKLLGDFFED